MNLIFLDFETFSTRDLPLVGAHKYARDAGIYCMGYAINDGSVSLWKNTDPLPEDFLEAMRGEHRLIAHNAHFEMLLWEHVLTPCYGFPMFKPENFVCTMAEAYAMALPGSLEKCALALGLDAQKDMKSSRIAVQVSQPRSIDPKTGAITWWEDMAKFEILYKYCKQDVEVQRQIYKRTLRLSDSERRIWLKDYEINKRGVYCDLPLIEKAIELVEKEKTRLDERMALITNRSVASCNATSQIVNFLRSEGLEVESIAKSEVIKLLSQPLSERAKECLELRQEAAKSSTAKLISMKNRADDDNRMRGLYQYWGARTGRFSGRGPQPQNFPRNIYGDADVEKIVSLITKSELDGQYGPNMSAVSSILRAFITASPGRTLLGADFSSIEARALAWLSGQEDVLEIFRGHGKIYEHSASQIYRKPIEKITKEERQIGKVAVLALGYGGGKGAFQSMARNYGVTVSDDKAEDIKKNWREANSKIVRYWRELEDAALQAVRDPGKKMSAGPKGREVTFLKKGIALWCRLPSGRLLSYPYVKEEVVTTPWGAEKDAVTVMTELSPSRKWGREPMHGGIFAENVTQAISRDLLTEAILRLEENGYSVMLHTHDEIVCEEKEINEDHFLNLMTTVPAWALGLPIAANAFSGKRYTK